MRNYAEETQKRVQFIKDAVAAAHVDGIIFGNSGGKDSALVGILCKMACENTEGIIMPCSSKRNFTIDKDDGMEVADQFGIKTRVIDLTAQKELAMENLSAITTEIFEFLRYLNAPQSIITKAPSAGLFEGQTDEQDMGVTYAAIDKYITTGEADEADKTIIDRYHARSEHKRREALRYRG